MELRERRNREVGDGGGAPAPVFQAGGADAGATAEAMLSVADSAIDSALSQDPTRFLRDNRQYGGQ